MQADDRRELAESIFASLPGRSMTGAEVVLKRGRSRRCETGPQGQVVSSSSEQGWAIRATNARASLFVAGSGDPEPQASWPDPDGQSLDLPPPQDPGEWPVPGDLDASLMSETESIALLSGIERELGRELAGARLLRSLLEEGTSDTAIFNTHGVATTYRSRAASLYLQALGPWRDASTAMLLLAEREVRRFQPQAIAKRLANRLSLQHHGAAPERERGDLLLGPAVAVRLLEGLRPLFVGADAEALAQSLFDRGGRLASSQLTVIDDGRLPKGVLSAPVDGEGVPTGEVLLIDEGSFCRSLVGWERQEADRASRSRLIGTRRRDSWRDLPRLGPSHLYVRPDESVSVAALLRSIARGHYLVDAIGGGRFDFASDRFELPVCGFQVQQGTATAPLARVWLEGGIGSLLRGIQGVARDLSFEPLGGMIGSPSLLVSGLGLRGRRG